MTTSATSLKYPDPTNLFQYSADLVQSLGAPLNSQNIGTIAAWGSQERAYGFSRAGGYNILGTELQLPGSTSSNSAGVQNYSSLSSGLQAAVDMLTGSGPQTTALGPGLVKDMRSGASLSTLVSDFRNTSGNWNGTPGQVGPDYAPVVQILSHPNNAAQGQSGYNGSFTAGVSSVAQPGFTGQAAAWFERNILGNPVTGGLGGLVINQATAGSGGTGGGLSQSAKNVASAANPANWFSGVTKWIEAGAADVGFVLFGAALVFVGLFITFSHNSEGQPTIIEKGAEVAAA